MTSYGGSAREGGLHHVVSREVAATHRARVFTAASGPRGRRQKGRIILPVDWQNRLQIGRIHEIGVKRWQISS
jgi:hypothetical protein